MNYETREDNNFSLILLSRYFITEFDHTNLYLPGVLEKLKKYEKHKSTNIYLCNNGKGYINFLFKVEIYINFSSKIGYSYLVQYTQSYYNKEN